MIKWEQAEIRHSKTEKTPIPLYNGYVECFDKPVIKIEQEYHTASGFKDNWWISMFDIVIAEIKGTVHESGKIKMEAVRLLKQNLTDITNQI